MVRVGCVQDFQIEDFLMARARGIKPGFYKNEDLAECSIWARFIFPGLWMLADREGRLEDRPKRIKGELLPFDTQDVEPLLVELEERKFLERYSNEDGEFIQISKFSKHQTPHYSEKDSVIKPPNSEKDSVIKNGENQRTPENSGNDASLRGGRNPLTPDSLTPDSLTPEVIPPLPPDGGSAKAGTVVPAPKTDTPKPEYQPLFVEFWSAYPKKVGKDAAAKAFDKRKPNRELVQAMVKAIRLQQHSENWQKQGGQFIPNPATWINEGRWKDEGDSLSGDGGIWAAKPAWVVDAGFEDVADAHSSRCYEHNSHQFQNGKRIEVTS